MALLKRELYHQVKGQLRMPWPHEARGHKRPVPDLSALPREEAERARRRLDQLDGACGCKFAVAITVVALAVYIMGVASWLDLTKDNAWAIGAIGLVVLVVGAVAGKTLGLRRARRQRDRLLDELYSHVETVDGLHRGASNASRRLN